VLRDETHDVDVIVVVGHTPLRNSTGLEYDLVLSAIRAHLPTIPVQFFGGHSHIRDFRKYDDLAHGIESGRYLETLGWINMDLNPFRLGRRYIDNNLGGYRFHTEIEEEQEFETHEGKAISEEIQKKVTIFILRLMVEEATGFTEASRMCTARLLYSSCAISFPRQHLLTYHKRGVSETGLQCII
jgi:2',3'-cyclic-nucleotide 2'-phosphodiesterase (5'-nucleotidase family)